jgi:hypothetical protein
MINVTMRTTRVPAAMAAALLLLAAGCTPTVKVKHEVEPIHLTADINIRVDRQLDQFFAYQDQPGATTRAATQGATTAATTAAATTQTASGDPK